MHSFLLPPLLTYYISATGMCIYCAVLLYPVQMFSSFTATRCIAAPPTCRTTLAGRTSSHTMRRATTRCGSTTTPATPRWRKWPAMRSLHGRATRRTRALATLTIKTRTLVIGRQMTSTEACINKSVTCACFFTYFLVIRILFLCLVTGKRQT